MIIFSVQVIATRHRKQHGSASNILFDRLDLSPSVFAHFLQEA